MKSSLFLNNITVIDHGYIGNDGRQHGGSFNASFEAVIDRVYVENIDPSEQSLIERVFDLE